ncbi:MAG: tryptophan synthase alpha chain [Paraglaciecola sp.]|jgi:tryptophan synthase alpha chain
MTRLNNLFQTTPNQLLNIYFTAGYPSLNDTETIILQLEKAGADLIEIGVPFSDPLADGPTIQDSGTAALKNGMNLPLLFEQIENVRKQTQIPLIIMGYFNQVMQYGEDAFIQKCVEVGVDGVILPDLPLFEYEKFYQEKFEKAGLAISFLITPQTSPDRIQKVDELTTGFVYVVADSSITGSSKGLSEAQLAYFQRVKNAKLKNPTMIGFGISNNETFSSACQFANGAIIGSAFIRALGKGEELEKTISEFVGMVRGEKVVA